MLYIKAKKNNNLIYFELNKDLHHILVNNLIDYGYVIEKSTQNEYYEKSLIPYYNYNTLNIEQDFDICDSDCFSIENLDELEIVNIYLDQIKHAKV